MSLRIRRGTDAQRSGITFDLGEIVWTTDESQLWVGDGVTPGGRSIAESIAGTGLQYNSTTGRLETNILSFTSDQITEGSNNLYFSVDRAQDAAASLFTTGVHTGISFTYDDVLNRINATVNIGTEVVQDDVALMFINGIHSGISFVYDDGNGRINATTVTNTEEVQDIIGAMFVGGTQTGISITYSDSLGLLDATVSAEYIQDTAALMMAGGLHTGLTITYDDNNGLLEFAVLPQSLVDDTNPFLGGDLDLNDFAIIGTGDIDITGYITSLGDITAQNLVLQQGTIVSTSSIDLVGPQSRSYASTGGTLLNFSRFMINSYTGTYDTPLQVPDDAYSTGIVFNAYTEEPATPDYHLNAAIVTKIDAAAVYNETTVPGVPASVNVVCKSANAAGLVTYTFDSKGTFTAPVIKPGVYVDSTERDTFIPNPEYGMIVYLSSTSKFSGYVNDAGLGSPGWVNLN